MIGTARAGGEEPALLAGLLERTKSLTARPFGVNFIIHENSSINPLCFELAASAARVVEFFLYAAPDPVLIDSIHRQGTLVAAQIGSREQAVAAVDAGCDLIIAQGIGAGGHVRGTIGLLALLDEVLAAVPVPVLAAGGIGSGRALAAALAAGADGARVGTRFVAAEESNAHPTYVEALLAARAADTVYTEAYSTNWPNAPHRVLRSCVAAATAFAGDVVGETQSLDGTWGPVHLFDCLAIDRGTTGAIEAMPHWAGESVSAVTRVQPAAEIVRELAEEAERLLRRW
jgi:NAD(P)H-dependent flavin oxidoreductase YrpB (nitropropane dioxygenase family)